MKKMKKFAALALSASMVMGMTLTSMAAEPEVSVDAPIYAYDITNVVVPTSYVVAFNPTGLDVNKNGSTVQDQIVSKDYGIINKSTQDKIITVTLKVEDLNEGKITFAADPDDVTSAAENDYVVNLTLVPADGTEVKVGTTSAVADLTTTGADLGNVTMTPVAPADDDDPLNTAITSLVAGENEVDFLLAKAKYTGTINLDSATTNNVKDDFTLTALADNGKGITAFTLKGTMNTNTDWTKLTKGIRITAIYSNENAPANSTNNVVSGTGAFFVNPNPVFKTGAEVGTIKYKAGTGNDAIASITSITLDYNGTAYDGYNELANNWEAAVDEGGKIILPLDFVASFQAIYPDDMVKEVAITYTTVGGDSKTVNVNVRLQIPVVTAPSFTMGSEVGTINYEVGTGEDALASIISITMDYDGTPYDGYNELTDNWGAAVDENGKITFSSEFVQSYSAQYPSDATREATVTYVTSGGETKTATVYVKIS